MLKLKLQMNQVEEKEIDFFGDSIGIQTVTGVKIGDKVTGLTFLMVVL